MQAVPSNWRIETEERCSPRVTDHVGRHQMARRFKVNIDRHRLLTNLAREDGRVWSDLELDQWLTEAGFTRLGDGSWTVAEENLGHLDPTEVISADPSD